MAIRPVQEKWILYVKGLTGEKHEISVEKVRIIYVVCSSVSNTIIYLLMQAAVHVAIIAYWYHIWMAELVHSNLASLYYITKLCYFYPTTPSGNVKLHPACTSLILSSDVFRSDYLLRKKAQPVYPISRLQA